VGFDDDAQTMRRSTTCGPFWRARRSEGRRCCCCNTSSTTRARRGGNPCGCANWHRDCCARSTASHKRCADQHGLGRCRSSSSPLRHPVEQEMEVCFIVPNRGDSAQERWMENADGAQASRMAVRVALMRAAMEPGHARRRTGRSRRGDSGHRPTLVRSRGNREGEQQQRRELGGHGKWRSRHCWRVPTRVRTRGGRVDGEGRMQGPACRRASRSREGRIHGRGRASTPARARTQEWSPEGEGWRHGGRLEPMPRRR
jgi:hypothetical protein